MGERAGSLRATRDDLPPAPTIVACDRDAGAIETTIANAERAGVADLVHTHVVALSATGRLDEVRDAASGIIVTNPPYGVRVTSSKGLRDLYASLGNLAKGPLASWDLAFLAADDTLARATGLALSPLLRTKNGGIDVTLWQRRQLTGSAMSACAKSRQLGFTTPWTKRIWRLCASRTPDSLQMFDVFVHEATDRSGGAKIDEDRGGRRNIRARQRRAEVRGDIDRNRGRWLGPAMVRGGYPEIGGDRNEQVVDRPEIALARPIHRRGRRHRPGRRSRCGGTCRSVRGSGRRAASRRELHRAGSERRRAVSARGTR